MAAAEPYPDYQDKVTLRSLSSGDPDWPRSLHSPPFSGIPDTVPPFLRCSRYGYAPFALLRVGLGPTRTAYRTQGSVTHFTIVRNTNTLLHICIRTFCRFGKQLTLQEKMVIIKREIYHVIFSRILLLCSLVISSFFILTFITLFVSTSSF